MLPKPAHLGPEFGAQFADASVVGAYRFRPPYPAEVFDILTSFAPAEPLTLLDLGCGTGEIARRMASRAGRVDAIDPSVRMLREGQSLPGGEAKNIRWILGRGEDAPLQPPYDLVIAGASLHWMEWDIVLPRIDAALSAIGFLCIVEQVQQPVPWGTQLAHILREYSTNREFQPYDIVHELAIRNAFDVAGHVQTAPQVFEQPLAEYVESFHARNGFSRDRMTREAAAAFDQLVADVVAPHLTNAMVQLRIHGSITWGRPSLRGM
jgi:ubiquinone/menaquinone biosynthesis C-methylase UbiE